MANATARIGHSQHFVVQMPGEPGSFWKAARAAGIKPGHDSMREAIETTSFEQAIVRGNYWCGVNGIKVDKSAPHGFNFIDTPEYAAAVQAGVKNELKKKIPEGWNVVAVHGRSNSVLPENEWHQAYEVWDMNQFADLLRQKGYTGGPVLLFACRTGVLAKPEHNYTLAVTAQRLANALRVPVVAPSRYVFASKNGRLETREGRWAYEGTPQQTRVPTRRFARWRCFAPAA